MPKISIVLPSYNGQKYIRQSIESVINQTFKDWELIVVNDCSSDRTKEIVKEYLSKDRRINLINNDMNYKLPRSLNIGFEAARGEYLTWTSDDNLYKPFAVEKMLQFLETNKQYFMVRADMEMIDDMGKRISYSPEFRNGSIYMQNYVGACFLYRRQVMEKVGEYDTALFGVEDYDYWLRAYEIFGEIASISEPLYEYRVHGESVSQTKKSIVDINRKQMYLKHMDFIVKSVSDPIVLTKIYMWIATAGITRSDMPIKLLEAAPYLKKIVPLDTSRNDIVVYGAGEMGRKVYRYLGKKIQYFIDKDKKKADGYVNGVRIRWINDIDFTDITGHLIVAVSGSVVGSVLFDLDARGVSQYSLWELRGKGEGLW